MDSTSNIWGPTGALAQQFADYEARPEQQRMAEAVALALDSQQHLLVEAGTGTGKSLAYLLPSLLMAHRDNATVIVSTGTINLQEQLINKDIPLAVRVLENAGLVPRRSLRTTALKGKGNYLCASNLSALRATSPELRSQADASLLQKTAAWQTITGDRAELQVHPTENFAWQLISAQYNNGCPDYKNGESSCYLHKARLRAQQAHLVVVNHALLLADINNNEHYLGHARHIIIDEAHHLEDEASRQFGWELSQGHAARLLSTLRGDPVLADLSGRVQTAWDGYWQHLTQSGPAPDQDQYASATTITPTLRATTQWRSATLAAASLSEACLSLFAGIDAQCETARQAGDPAREIQLLPVREDLAEARQQINSTMVSQDPEQIQWIQSSRAGGTSLHSVPLRVGPILRDKLFDHKKSVVLTSATLTTEPQDFGLLREQTGFPDTAPTISFPSPFDYPHQARFMSPTDMPEPTQRPAFDHAVANCLTELAISLDGRTLALFTSYSALDECSTRIRPVLADHHIDVLAQGQDGVPADIIDQFRRNPRAVILGAGSFWEGVDLSEDLLHAVAVCRLPFPVPSDPIIAARSSQFPSSYEAFRNYITPMAILRFRQGCGRLIRNNNSRGSIVILDPRIRNPGYGSKFVRSIPRSNMIRSQQSTIGQLASEWILHR